MDDIHTHVLSIDQTVADMKTSMSDMQSRMSELEEAQNIQNLDGIENNNSIATLEGRLEKVEKDLELKAREERKPNVILHDVKEQQGDDDTS